MLTSTALREVHDLVHLNKIQKFYQLFIKELLYIFTDLNNCAL